jgi:hypothetical protein
VDVEVSNDVADGRGIATAYEFNQFVKGGATLRAKLLQDG